MPGILLATAGVPYGPSVTFRTQGILPPSALYVAPGDALVLQFRCPTATIPVMLTVRILSPEGEVKEIQAAFSLNTAGFAVGTFNLLPTEGFILSAHLAASSGIRGQCFTKLFLQKNPGASDQTLGALLFQGYVSADDHLSYPQSPTESSLAGRGNVRTIQIANPAPGFGIGIGMTSGTRWMLHAFGFFFTTSAAAGNRTVFMDVAIPGANQILYSAGWPGSLGPSSSLQFAAGQGCAAANNNSVAGISLPVGWMWPPLTTMNVFANFQAAADQFSNIVLLVEEWVSQ